MRFRLDELLGVVFALSAAMAICKLIGFPKIPSPVLMMLPLAFVGGFVGKIAARHPVGWITGTIFGFFGGLIADYATTGWFYPKGLLLTVTIGGFGAVISGYFGGRLVRDV